MVNPIKRAIIVGGGIGGLCAAIALRQIGVDVTVYEKVNELSDVGAGLTLWANAIKALRRLGLAEAVLKHGAKIQKGEFRTWRGKTLASIQTGELEQLYGDPTIAIHRADLHRILLAALPEDAVRWGAACTGFDQAQERVSVHFTNGQIDQADLLIGADGIHSVVRQQLFPHVTLRYSGYSAWRGVVSTEDEVALGVAFETWGRGSRFGMVRINQQQVYWFATANMPAGQRQTATQGKAWLQQRFRGWHHPVESLLAATSAEAILHNDIYDFKPIKQWSQGRVTLLGDAAHPTTPNMGQGACQAIESSVVLARSLGQGNEVAASLRQYEIERMPRTAWITNQSWRIGQMGQLENNLACALRDFVMSLTPASILKKQMGQAASYVV
jgi:2-polyprenyl-6-methoxyphenol hydroxylase-like FAD-dependent oxidoreductase